MANKLHFGNSPIIIKPKAKHTATVIWLHGLGDSGNGWNDTMTNIANKCDWIKFILPTAPYLNVTLNGGSKMPAWHDIESLNDLDKAIAGFKYRDECKELITGLIDEEVQSGIPSYRILLGGFSQGGAMSIYCGLSYKTGVAGIVGLSSYLPNAKCDEWIIKENKNTPILLYHAKQDGVVDTKYGKLTCKELRKHGCKNVSWNIADIAFTMYTNFGHSTNDKEIKDVERFITNILDKNFKLNDDSDNDTKLDENYTIDNVHELQTQGKEFYKKGKFDNALNVLEQSLIILNKLDKKDPKLFIELNVDISLCYYKIKKFDICMDTCNTILSMDSGNFKATNILSDVLMERNQLIKAKQACSNYLKDPKNQNRKSNETDIIMKKRNDIKALIKQQKSAKKSPPKPDETKQDNNETPIIIDGPEIEPVD